MPGLRCGLERLEFHTAEKCFRAEHREAGLARAGGDEARGKRELRQRFIEEHEKWLNVGHNPA